ncbi:ATP-binding cassette, subfamily F, member 3 [Alkalispirochaeta americana]|uniref:ATP-binding cassette, subfamily F, member 3 n=1 Tax=Alkalispirochaeta americana TaxID=159291 RepID=A0A1N6NXB9_9SPIO|nr:ABC-F family ATP-binding cassette domain-containing protein [Alkalispirochaeta americana]SIP96775.1 ATP-binding cassette, subfamily F, member 3 [Alkalispirochaeta americana]
MISVTQASLGFGGQHVLSGVSLTLNKETRAALVGANGSGKTTLLRILAGKTAPDSGSVTIARGMTVAYLPQQSTFPPGATIYQVAEEGFQREQALAEQRREKALALQKSPHSESLLMDVAALDQHLEEASYHTRHVLLHRVLKGLGFAREELDRPIATLSGGWAMRVALARTLLTRPDFLLLDEPTNYLDSESRLWLSGFLSSFEGGFLLVSHDRAFLDDTTREIFELFMGTVKRYRGPYSAYQKQREEEVALLVKRWEEQQREIARQEDFIRRFRAQANKARQVQSRIKMLEKIERVEIPEHLAPITITLPPAAPSGKVVLEAQELSRSYGTRCVLKGVSFTMTRGQRLAVVGRNGAGKSTLLRILAQEDQDYHGLLKTGTGVLGGYFAQDTPEKLPGEKTVLTYLEEQAAPGSISSVRDILGAFLFRGEAVEKRLGVLSGGERTRLAMAALLLQPLNLLILDEPTNHLDITSQEVLARALRTYQGTVVIVSHDRHFLRAVTTDVLALWPEGSSPGQNWQFYPGTFQEFEESSLGRIFDDPNPVTEASPSHSSRNKGNALHGDTHESTSSGPAAVQYARQKAQKGEIRRLERLEAEQMAEIERLEEELATLHQEMALPEVYRDPQAIQQRQARLPLLEQALEETHETWEKTTQALEELTI